HPEPIAAQIMQNSLFHSHTPFCSRPHRMESDGGVVAPDDQALQPVSGLSLSAGEVRHEREILGGVGSADGASRFAFTTKKGQQLGEAQLHVEESFMRRYARSNSSRAL